MCKKNILLIEDNPADSRLVKEAFMYCNLRFKIFIASDGQEGINFMQKKNKYKSSPTPDLILLDLNLPKVKGLEVLDYLKNKSEFKYIPVIVLTSSDDPEDIKQSYNLYANSYIKKEIDFFDFQLKINELINFWFETAKLPRKPIERKFEVLF